MTIKKQVGSALIITLLFLLIMTILGVAGIQTTSMQERMSGNWRDRIMAFQASEAALRAGENFIRDNDDNETLFISSINNPEKWNGENGTSYSLSEMLADHPKFHVNEPGLYRVNPGELPAEFHNVYPVISIGWGGTEVTTVVLESKFRPVQ